MFYYLYIIFSSLKNMPYILRNVVKRFLLMEKIIGIFIYHKYFNDIIINSSIYYKKKKYHNKIADQNSLITHSLQIRLL
jgi:hypothetical protein